MKNIVTPIKNHVVKHRFKYGLALGLTAGLALNMRTAKVHNEFLKEHNLFDEFYVMDED